MMRTGPRSTSSTTLLIALGAALLWTAILVIGTERGVLNPDVFSRRLAATLEDERVAGYVAGRITDGIVAQRPNLVSVRPVIESGVRGVVVTAPFRALVRRAARALHYSLFEAGGGTVVLSLPDVSVLVRGALAQASPALAAKLPPGIETNLASPRAERAFARFVSLWRVAERVLWGAWAVFAIGLVLLVAAIRVAPDRPRALVQAGGALFAVGIALLAILPAGRIVAAALTPDADARGVLHGLWLAYFGAAKPAAVMFGGVGVVLVAAGSTLLEEMRPLARAQAFWNWLAVPERPGRRISRAVLLLGAGTYGLVAPAHAAAMGIAVGGLLLVFFGVREVFRLVLPAIHDAPLGGARQQRARAWPIMAVTGAVVLAVLGGGALLVMRSPEPPPEATGVATVCNGSAALCDRRLDQVVFAGAHNAMSNAEIPGWMFPHHHFAFPRQLADGVRALAIDIHYGIPAEDRVLTDMDREHSSQEKIQELIGPDATAAALRIRGRLIGKAKGESAIYFCHGFCETRRLSRSAGARGHTRLSAREHRRGGDTGGRGLRDPGRPGARVRGGRAVALRLRGHPRADAHPAAADRVGPAPGRVH